MHHHWIGRLNDRWLQWSAIPECCWFISGQTSIVTLFNRSLFYCDMTNRSQDTIKIITYSADHSPIRQRFSLILLESRPVRTVVIHGKEASGVVVQDLSSKPIRYRILSAIYSTGWLYQKHLLPMLIWHEEEYQKRSSFKKHRYPRCVEGSEDSHTVGCLGKCERSSLMRQEEMSLLAFIADDDGALSLEKENELHVRLSVSVKVNGKKKVFDHCFVNAQC